MVKAFGGQRRICRPFVGVDRRVFLGLPLYERNEGGSVPVFDDEVAAIIAQDEREDPWPIDSRPLIPHGRAHTLVAPKILFFVRLFASYTQLMYIYPHKTSASINMTKSIHSLPRH